MDSELASRAKKLQNKLMEEELEIEEVDILKNQRLAALYMTIFETAILLTFLTFIVIVTSIIFSDPNLTETDLQFLGFLFYIQVVSVITAWMWRNDEAYYFSLAAYAVMLSIASGLALYYLFGTVDDFGDDGTGTCFSDEEFGPFDTLMKLLFGKATKND